ncbi:hypothetical protein BS78_08G015900 [Paspalum vaginatum]|nr:hypothetical protein BS78_08G015900 [Paspalum vaginatum]
MAKEVAKVSGSWKTLLSAKSAWKYSLHGNLDIKPLGTSMKGNGELDGGIRKWKGWQCGTAGTVVDELATFQLMTDVISRAFGFLKEKRYRMRFDYFRQQWQSKICLLVFLVVSIMDGPMERMLCHSSSS